MSPQVNSSSFTVVLVSHLFTADKKLTKTEIGARSGVIAVTNLTRWFISIWGILELVERILRCLAVRAKNALECCDWRLMADSYGPKKTRIAIGLWLVKTRLPQRMRTLWKVGVEATSYYVLAEKYSAFCPCPETFCKADFRSNGLLNRAKETSRQHNIQEVHGYCWRLLVKLLS